MLETGTTTVQIMYTPGRGTAIAAPTHSARMFEVRIELPEPANPAKRRRMRVVLRDATDGGDRQPDAGAVAPSL